MVSTVAMNDFVTATANTTMNTSVINDENEYMSDFFNPGTPFDIAMDCLLVLTLLTSLYLFVALLYYEWLLRRNSPPGSVKRNTRSQIGPWLRFLCILSALFSTLRSANDIAYYKGQTVSEIPCTVLKNLGVSWLTGVDTAVYLFLWLRHRVLYQNKNLGLNGNLLATIASGFALFLVVGLFVAMNMIIIGWRRYDYNPVTARCTSTSKLANKILGKTFVIGSSILHVVLVGLYIYPLVCQTLKMRQSKQSTQTTADKYKQGNSATKSSSAQNSKSQNLMKVVVKCVVLSLLCVITDGLSIILSEHVITNSRHSKLRHFVYNFNVIINTVAIVGSFKRWKSMLLPVCVPVVSNANLPKKESISMTQSMTMNANTAHRVST